MNDDWVKRYGHSHTHPVNRICHLFGIPMILVSLILAGLALALPVLWPWAIGLFVAGWALQFIGHAFERKPPEFLKDIRFLWVGLRWWSAEVRHLLGPH